jgi:uncharacterized protein DUF6463
VRRLLFRSLPGEGAQLRALAVLHALVGAVFYRRELGAIRRDGALAGIPYRGPKPTAFWFLLASPLVWTIGRLVGDAEAATDWAAVRRAHRLGLASAVVAILLMPVSGFWGWLAISLRGLRRAGSMNGPGAGRG